MKCKALGRFTTLDEQICKLRCALRMRGDDSKAVEQIGDNLRKEIARGWPILQI